MDGCLRNRRRSMACFIILIGVLSSKALLVSSSYQEQKSRDNDGDTSPNYKFQYAVNEGEGGNDFGHEEERNGAETRGQYRVLLPDGRRQIVTYTADKNGYRAEVTYENQGGGSGDGYSAPIPAKKSPPPKSYGPPPKDEGSTPFGRRSTGSFVKVRRNDIVGGNYNYSF